MTVVLSVVISVWLSTFMALWLGGDPKDRTPLWVLLIWPLNLLWAILVVGMR